MKYRVIKCWCWKGESLGTSINNTRNQRADATFDTCQQAEEYLAKLKKWEAERIEHERQSDGWGGSEFVFWIDEVTG